MRTGLEILSACLDCARVEGEWLIVFLCNETRKPGRDHDVGAQQPQHGWVFFQKVPIFSQIQIIDAIFFSSHSPKICFQNCSINDILDKNLHFY